MHRIKKLRNVYCNSNESCETIYNSIICCSFEIQSTTQICDRNVHQISWINEKLYSISCGRFDTFLISVNSCDKLLN